MNCLTLSGTTWVSRYHKGKTRKVKPIWIYWSKRYLMAMASTVPYANLHLAQTYNHTHIPPLTVQNLVAVNIIVWIIWKFQYLACMFGLKMPIHSSKVGVFRRFDPLYGVQYQQNPKWHVFVWVRIVWAVKRENLLMGLTCRWIYEKGINKKLVIFYAFAQKPHWNK